MRVIDYILQPIDGTQSIWLTALNKYIDEGYELHGGPFHDVANETTYQAVVKYDKG